MIVDANIAVYWAVPGAHVAAATIIMERPDLAAPSLLLPEAANGLINHARLGTIGFDQIGPILTMIGEAIDLSAVDADLVPDALAIAIAHRHKIHHCLYLALARQRREPLATADRRLATLARMLSIETELIEPAL